MQTPENLHVKPAEEKTTVKDERDSTKSERLQWGLNTLLLIQFFRVRSLTKEEELDFYNWGIVSWVVGFEIFAVEFAHDRNCM